MRLYNTKRPQQRLFLGHQEKQLLKYHLATVKKT